MSYSNMDIATPIYRHNITSIEIHATIYFNIDRYLQRLVDVEVGGRLTTHFDKNWFFNMFLGHF